MPELVEFNVAVTLGILAVVLTGNCAVGGAQPSPSPLSVAAYDGHNEDYRVGPVDQRNIYVRRNFERGAKGQAPITAQLKYRSEPGIWLQST